MYEETFSVIIKLKICIEILAKLGIQRMLRMYINVQVLLALLFTNLR